MMHIMMEALAVRTIFTSAMSKSTSFWRKISICSLNFSWTTFFPAPLEYSEAVWQIDPAKSTPPSWATPLARSHAAWFILVVWNKISKQYFYRLFFFLVGGGEGIQILILQLCFMGKIQKQSLELRPSTLDQTWCFGPVPLLRSPSKTVAPKKFNDKIIPTPCLACSPPRSSSKVNVNAWITSDPARKNSRCSCRTKKNIIQNKVQRNLALMRPLLGQQGGDQGKQVFKIIKQSVFIIYIWFKGCGHNNKVAA